MGKCASNTQYVKNLIMIQRPEVRKSSKWEKCLRIFSFSITKFTNIYLHINLSLSYYTYNMKEAKFCLVG